MSKGSRHLLGILVVGHILFNGPSINRAHAQGKILRPLQHQVFDAKSKVRVGNAYIVVSPEGKGVMNFEAASLDVECDLSGDKSSWLAISLVDDQGKSLTPFNNVEVAQVQGAGAYQSHAEISLDSTQFPPPLLKAASAFQMQLRGNITCK